VQRSRAPHLEHYGADGSNMLGESAIKELTGGGDALEGAPADRVRSRPEPEPERGTGGRCASDSDCEQEDEELVRREAELTKDVPQLLETMNRTSGELNTAERQLGEAQARHRNLLEKLSRVHEEQRVHYGTSIDRARPYFEAAEASNAANARVQRATGEFTAAQTQHSQAKSELRAIEERLAYGAHKIALDSRQQDGLSRATVRVLRCQNERDACEREYMTAVREFQQAREAAETFRREIGDSTIRKALPCFRELQQHQQNLAAEQTRISTLTERAKAAKSAYNASMNELDRISNDVHTFRKEYLARKKKQEDAAARSQAPETEVPEAVGGEHADASETKFQAPAEVCKAAAGYVSTEAPVAEAQVSTVSLSPSAHSTVASMDSARRRSSAAEVFESPRESARQEDAAYRLREPAPVATAADYDSPFA